MVHCSNRNSYLGKMSSKYLLAYLSPLYILQNHKGRGGYLLSCLVDYSKSVEQVL